MTQVGTETQREFTILWAGGWDKFLLDTAQIRTLTPKEQADNEWRRGRGAGRHPICVDESGVWWVQCCFLTKGLGGPIEIGAEGQCVKVIRRIDHGN